jgi:hypothetical protein
MVRILSALSVIVYTLRHLEKAVWIFALRVPRGLDETRRATFRGSAPLMG